MADPQRQRTYAKRTLVSFPVEHGDVVIMWGDNTHPALHGACREVQEIHVVRGHAAARDEGRGP